MNPRRRVALLAIIMVLIVVLVGAIGMGLQYRAALDEEESRLVEMARSQARLIEAVARFNREHGDEYSQGARQATLAQIRDAHARYQGHGETGEFTLSERRGDRIVFLLSHRHYDMDEPVPVPWNSKLAEPMRRALSGLSGTVVGLDYRGVKVLAAYEPVGELGLGIVSKIDCSEIQAPFLHAIYLSVAIALVAIVIGVVVFSRITNPIIERLQDTVTQLKGALAEVKTLRGILPICSYCKKIRDDHGSWAQMEAYVSKHTCADFSHSVCPECMSEHYPDFHTENRA